jgi:hypothetical protein
MLETLKYVFQIADFVDIDGALKCMCVANWCRFMYIKLHNTYFRSMFKDVGGCVIC